MNSTVSLAGTASTDSGWDRHQWEPVASTGSEVGNSAAAHITSELSSNPNVTDTKLAAFAKVAKLDEVPLRLPGT